MISDLESYWGHVYRYTSLWVDVRGGGITQRRPENGTYFLPVDHIEPERRETSISS
jgi:hypothetical protein